MHLQQTTALRQAVLTFSESAGEKMSLEVEKNSILLMLWLNYLFTFHRTGVADNLLDAVGSSTREVAAALSLGLARPALFSLRTQADLLLSWLYFKDHPTEWAHVNDTAEGYKLKKELLQYFDQYFPGFGARMGIMRATISRKEPEPYRLLSAHIHSQSTPVLPAVNELRNFVKSEAECMECAQVAFEVSEYLNDILLAIFVPSWPTLPTGIQVAAMSRFQTDEQKGAFFA